MKIVWDGKGKLTKKRALFLCWKLWEWLGENPRKEKSQWPEWKANKGRVQKTKKHCPCCEIGIESTGCHECPLKGYWSRYEGRGECEYYDSPYSKWGDESGPKKRTKYARRIAAAAKRRYEKL